jgi:hypothetical protein
MSITIATHWRCSAPECGVELSMHKPLSGFPAKLGLEIASCPPGWKIHEGRVFCPGHAPKIVRPVPDMGKAIGDIMRKARR